MHDVFDHKQLAEQLEHINSSNLVQEPIVNLRQTLKQIKTLDESYSVFGHLGSKAGILINDIIPGIARCNLEALCFQVIQIVVGFPLKSHIVKKLTSTCPNEFSCTDLLQVSEGPVCHQELNLLWKGCCQMSSHYTSQRPSINSYLSCHAQFIDYEVENSLSICLYVVRRRSTRCLSIASVVPADYVYPFFQKEVKPKCIWLGHHVLIEECIRIAHDNGWHIHVDRFL